MSKAPSGLVVTTLVAPARTLSSRIILRRRSEFSRPRLTIARNSRYGCAPDKRTKPDAGQVYVSFVRPLGLEPRTPEV